MYIIEDKTETLNLALPGHIRFCDNQELMLHLNRKYTGYNFYTMQGPVGLTNEGKTIEAARLECTTTANLNQLDWRPADEKTFEPAHLNLTYVNRLYEDIVEPIIAELLAHTTQKDIYLYLITPTIVTGPKECTMTFSIRGHF